MKNNKGMFVAILIIVLLVIFVLCAINKHASGMSEGYLTGFGVISSLNLNNRYQICTQGNLYEPAHCELPGQVLI